MSLFGTPSSGSIFSARSGLPNTGASGGSETLAQVLHNDSSIVVGQNPTGAPGLAPTTIEGERATLNLDSATLLPSLRPSIAGFRGAVGLAGVSYPVGNPPAVNDGESISLTGGVAANGSGGNVYIIGGDGTEIRGVVANGDVDIRGGVSSGTDPGYDFYGNVNITSGGSADVAGRVVITTSAGTDGSGVVSITTGDNSRDTGPVFIQTGNTNSTSLCSSGPITLMTGDLAGPLMNGSGWVTLGTGNLTDNPDSPPAWSPADSGSVQIYTGETFGNAKPGHIYLFPGNYGRTTTPGEVVFSTPFGSTPQNGRHLCVRQATTPTSTAGAQLAQFSSDMAGALLFTNGGGPVGGTATVTFNSPYSAAPFVTITTLDVGFQPATLTAVTSSGFTIKNPNDTGGGTWTGLTVYYMVICGQAQGGW